MGNGPSKLPSCSFPRTITQIVQLSTIWEAFHKKFVSAYVLKYSTADIYNEDNSWKVLCSNVFQNKILLMTMLESPTHNYK